MNNALFLFDSEDGLQEAIDAGAYSPRFNVGEDGEVRWRDGHRRATADLVCLQPRGWAFLFAKRGIYGIGRLADPAVVLNHPDALASDPGDRAGILPGTPVREHRFVVRFDPAESKWLPQPADMDDVLVAGGDIMYALRTMERVSLAVFDEDESRAFEQQLWLQNADQQPRTGGDPPDAPPVDIGSLGLAVDKTDELALETDLAWRLNHGPPLEAFEGSWDSAIRQVTASPPKPVAYIDQIDLLARRLDPTDRFARQHGVLELKNGRATKVHAEQLMRYVDWVADRYHQGRYDRVRAFLVANEFGARLRDDLEEVAPRFYTVDPRRPRARTWRALKLVSATRDEATGSYSYDVAYDLEEEGGT